MCDRQASSLSCPDSLAGEDAELSSQEDEEEGVFVYAITIYSTRTSSSAIDYYADYYGHDEDALGPGEGGDEDGATDASFQHDPEHYSFTCLSEEEAWNYLDMQVKDMAREIKVFLQLFRNMHEASFCYPGSQHNIKKALTTLILSITNAPLLHKN